MDGLSLTIGGTLGAAIVSAVVKIWTAKQHAAETKIPQPCGVSVINDCISVKECNRRMKDLDDRVTRLEQKFDSGFDKIMQKLSVMDSEGEQRSVALHRRLDGVVEKVAETRGEVGLIKDKMFKRK